MRPRVMARAPYGDNASEAVSELPRYESRDFVIVRGKLDRASARESETA
jgi:hypothetical protein